jgi:hypothetical protein
MRPFPGKSLSLYSRLQGVNAEREYGNTAVRAIRTEMTTLKKLNAAGKSLDVNLRLVTQFIDTEYKLLWPNIFTVPVY